MEHGAVHADEYIMDSILKSVLHIVARTPIPKPLTILAYIRCIFNSRIDTLHSYLHRPIVLGL